MSIIVLEVKQKTMSTSMEVVRNKEGGKSPGVLCSLETHPHRRDQVT